LTQTQVPSGTFKDETDNISAFFADLFDIINALLGDFSTNEEFIQFLFFGSTNHLFNSSKERLRIEESGNHDHFGNCSGFIFENIQLVDSLDQIIQPGSKSSLRRIGQSLPINGNSIQGQRFDDIFHGFRDSQEALNTL
jgi:hypothetical protein